jgi:AcrR family transcriptional regulator
MSTTDRVAAPRGETNKGARTRQRILDAAAKLLGERGPDGLATADIAKEAGMSKGSVYYYFTDCEQIVREVVLGEVESMVGRFERAAAQALSAHEALARISDSFMEMLWKDRALIRFVLSRVPLAGSMVATDDAEASSELADRLLNLIATQIERGKREGSVRPELDPANTASLLLGVFLAVAACGVKEAEATPEAYEQLRANLLNFVSYGLVAVPAASAPAASA